jgi:hypothetical protein
MRSFPSVDWGEDKVRADTAVHHDSRHPCVTPFC